MRTYINARSIAALGRRWVFESNSSSNKNTQAAPAISLGMVLATLLMLAGVGGCQTIQSPWGKQPVTIAEQVSASEVREERDVATRVTGLFSGKGSEDRQQARTRYQQADELFRTASQNQNSERRSNFRSAAKQYRKAAKEWPKSALEEDALLMAGECYFFADDLPKADSLYAEVLENYPRSRHVDRIVARRFEIAKFWLEADEKESSILPVNFTNKSLPALDIDGTGIKLLDQIRYDDPTGKLADDATMAAGIEYFEREKWITADDMFSDLRDTFPDSDHQFNAHLFGLKCKLEIYQGPQYSGVVLDEADELIKRMTRRFPRELSDPDTRALVAKSAAEIKHLKAERLWHHASFRLKKNQNGSARFYYQKILDEYADTAYADKSRGALQDIEGLPDTPPQRLAWLSELFPDSEEAKPLMVGSEGGILR